MIFPNSFKAWVMRMLIGIGVQTFKKLRSGSSLELNNGDKSEYVVPIVFD